MARRVLRGDELRSINALLGHFEHLLLVLFLGTLIGIAVFQVIPISPGSICRGLYVVYMMIKDRDFKEFINPESLRSLTQCYLESTLGDAEAGQSFQFEREGYFCVDIKLSTPVMPVFNRTVTLRDSWAKIEQQQAG